MFTYVIREIRRLDNVIRDFEILSYLFFTLCIPKICLASLQPNFLGAKQLYVTQRQIGRLWTAAQIDRPEAQIQSLDSES